MSSFTRALLCALALLTVAVIIQWRRSHRVEQWLRDQAAAESHDQQLQLAHLTRVAMMGRLSGSLAHELAQPLTAILSSAQAAQRVLANDRVDLGEVREILQSIVDDDRRAGEVIRRLRRLLRRGETQLQLLDVPQVIGEALTVTRTDLLEKHVTVNRRMAVELPLVRGDHVQIEQVMLNLIMNAADAMSDNHPQDRRIDVSVAGEGSVLRVSVTDSGAGIAPDQLERIFDAFYTTKRTGLGLGLAICRTIITAHGGKLWAASNGRRGSTFHFTLPVALGGKKR